MKEETHCPNHGLELQEMTLWEARKSSFFIRIYMMFSLQNTSRYDKHGEERIVLVCPKKDYLTEN